MNRHDILASYTTPSEPFERCRDKHPYLMGDVFNNENGQEFTLFHIQHGEAFGVMTNSDGSCYLKKYSKWLDLFKQGFKQNMEYVKKDQELEKDGLYAPRQLEDGTWVAVTRLMYTTAICVNFDMESYLMFESRYCFSHNDILPSWFTAIFWMAQFKNKMSLPIGNCAYRGILGNDPIYAQNETEKYYKNLRDFKLYPTINDMTLHEYAATTMSNLIGTFNAVYRSKRDAELDAELTQATQQAGLEYDLSTSLMIEQKQELITESA